MTLKDQILGLLNRESGLSDREITDKLMGRGRPQQSVNQACRQLEVAGLLKRTIRGDGIIVNYPKGSSISIQPRRVHEEDQNPLSEDRIKAVLKDWLENQGWQTQIAWGKERGVDIEAIRGDQRWLIEVKGPGSRNAMRVNYFLAILGELLQRINDPTARYSIALPDLQQYRRLWERLPKLAKERTGITLLLVTDKDIIFQQ